MKHILSLLFLLMTGVMFTAPSHAGSQPSLISFGVGQYDVLKNDPRNKAADFRLEYRFDTQLLPWDTEWFGIYPWVGAEVTSDGAAYGLGGFAFDLGAGPLVLTPTISVGFYHDGNGKNLGSFVEFRSSLELAWRFNDQSRIGVSIGHISNAGLTQVNSGAEIASIYYRIPTSRLFGE